MSRAGSDTPRLGSKSTPHCSEHAYYTRCDACVETCWDAIRKMLNDARGHVASMHEPPMGERAESGGDQVDGIGLIAAERQRQIEREGWTAEHDDGHEWGDLLAASDEYVKAALRVLNGEVEPDRPPIGWPWSADAWKPSGDAIRDLTRAGALIAAEIDRLQRAAGTVTLHRRITVHFSGGPWNGRTAQVDRVVAPVFAVGDEIGNHYWLNTKSDPPTYIWDVR